jgi:hypothetical protein
MASEFKSQLNLRLTPDASVYLTVTAFIDNEEEAEAEGARVFHLATAWCKGYDSANQAAS